MAGDTTPKTQGGYLAGWRTSTSKCRAPSSTEPRRGARARAEEQRKIGGGVAREREGVDREREGVDRERGAWQRSCPLACG